LDSTLQSQERVKVYVNSATGKDLDKVKLYLFNKGEKHVFDNAHLLKKIIYGGLPNESEFPTYINEDGNANKGSYDRTGIAPQSTALCGLDTIYFIGFNTKKKLIGQESALLNKHAKYKDGLKELVTKAHGINNDSFISENRKVTLDNFAPYISDIAIEQNFEQKYGAGYYTTETSVGDVVIEMDDGVDPEGVFKIEINFSEEMDITKKPDVYVSNGTENCKESNGLWKNNRQYESTFSSIDIGGEEFILEVSNAYDMGNNPIDIDPRTIAYRNERGSWNEHETGTDNNFVFKIKGYPPIIQGIVVRVDDHVYYTDEWHY
ncbi:MAG: hypothetical protein R6U31_04020, partial [bacterium]